MKWHAAATTWAPGPGTRASTSTGAAKTPCGRSSSGSGRWPKARGAGAAQHAALGTPTTGPERAPGADVP
eukprot:5225894-Pyramimonas_sp.AAC.1